MQNWAATVVDLAFKRLQQRYESSGQKALFEALGSQLSADSDPTACRKAAEELGMKEGALHVALHRMRQRFGECLREEIAQTVAHPSEVDEELRRLLSLL